MIYGYARVSTKGQARDGNSLEAQEKMLRENGAVKIYSEAFTGTKANRPEFEKLLNTLTKGDMLIVTKLDRFARSMAQGSEIVTELIARGVKVNILNIGVMDNTPTSKLIRNIFFSFAEFERDMIVERTQEGKAIAREKGVRVDGRPKVQVDNDAFQKFREKQKDGEMTVAECCEALNISRSTWYKKLSEMG